MVRTCSGMGLCIPIDRTKDSMRVGSVRRDFSNRNLWFCSCSSRRVSVISVSWYRRATDLCLRDTCVIPIERIIAAQSMLVTIVVLIVGGFMAWYFRWGQTLTFRRRAASPIGNEGCYPPRRHWP